MRSRCSEKLRTGDIDGGRGYQAQHDSSLPAPAPRCCMIRVPQVPQPKHFSTATYVHNRTPSKGLGRRTHAEKTNAHEVLNGTKQGVARLGPFAAPRIVEPKERLTSLMTMQRCILLLHGV